MANHDSYTHLIPKNDFDDYRPDRNLWTVAETRADIRNNYGVTVITKAVGDNVEFTFQGPVEKMAAIRKLYGAPR